MSKCPFWSTRKEYHECYDSCPMLKNDLGMEEQCVFKEYLLLNRINFKDVVKEDYNFLKKSIYDNSGIEY
ncbi:hypothetical protein UT300005_27130 [Clostridium sp. CTA-5]